MYPANLRDAPWQLPPKRRERWTRRRTEGKAVRGFSRIQSLIWPWRMAGGCTSSRDLGSCVCPVTPSRAWNLTCRERQCLEEDISSSRRYTGIFLGGDPPVRVCPGRKGMGYGEGVCALQLSRAGTKHQLWGLSFFPHFLLPGQAFTHFPH